MAREFLDYDPMTGITDWVEFTADGKCHVTSEQDVEPILDYAKELANSGQGDANFRGEGWLYAIIPPVVQAKMFKDGVNFLDPTQTKAVVDQINANYPYCKTTHRFHAVK